MENNWTNELLELENFFKSIELPASPVTLDKGVVIMDSERKWHVLRTYYARAFL